MTRPSKRVLRRSLLIDGQKSQRAAGTAASCAQQAMSTFVRKHQRGPRLTLRARRAMIDSKICVVC